jgi:hypothetical protein
LQPTAGDPAALSAAIRRGADLRVYTEFIHNEHIDVDSSSAERVRECAEFGVTYCLDGRWTAGIMSLRQPIELPVGFGPRPSLSFFLYNQDGRQAIARPFLDGQAPTAEPGPSPRGIPPRMPKYDTHDSFDTDTRAPSSNFTYHFETIRYCVSDTWREALSHDADGALRSGSVSDLVAAFTAGQAVKIGVSGICDDLAVDTPIPHELFVECGSSYYYEDRQWFITGSHPIIRVRPDIPMRYDTRAWDFGWLMLRSDGHVVYRRCDPYTQAFSDHTLRCAIRWFVR